KPISGSVPDLFLETILSFTNFGEHFPCRCAAKAERFGKLGIVGAQKRIGRFFLADGRRDRRLAVSEELPDFLRACRDSSVVRLDRLGKANIRGGIFVPAIKARVVG